MDPKTNETNIENEIKDNNYELKQKGYFVIKKTTLYLIAILLFVVYVVAFSVGTIVTLNKQSKEIVSLKQQLNSMTFGSNDSYVEELNIETVSYYKDFELTSEKYNELINSKSDFMLYFHSSTCTYCKQANVFVNQFISLGYADDRPIYFVTPEVANDVFESEGVESTPTLIIYKSDGTKQTYIGIDEIFNQLDTMVANLSN